MISKHKIRLLYSKLRRKMWMRFNDEINRKLAKKLVKKHINKYIWNNYKVTKIICDSTNNSSPVISACGLVVDVFIVKTQCPEKITLSFKV